MEKKSTPILFFLEYDDQNEENFKWYLGIDVEGGRLGEPPQLAARRSKQYDRGTNFFEKKNPKKKKIICCNCPSFKGHDACASEGAWLF